MLTYKEHVLCWTGYTNFAKNADPRIQCVVYFTRQGCRDWFDMTVSSEKSNNALNQVFASSATNKILW